MNTFCRYFNEGVCRSCDLIGNSYVDQIHQKESLLLTALEGIAVPPLDETVISEPTGFRNKAKFTVTGSIDSSNFGLVGEKVLDIGKDLSSCALHRREIISAVPVLREFLALATLAPYQIAERKGELKGVIMYVANGTQESYLRFILRSKEPIDRIRKHASFLLDRITGLEVISVNIQPVPHAILEGKDEIILTEKTVIQYQIGDRTYPLSPRSFVQTNQKIAEKLYSEAAGWIKSSGTKKLLELFCGQGFFTFTAREVDEAIGVEINPEAVGSANRYAQDHNLKNLRFLQADAGSVKQVLNDLRPDTILVNPPRKGLGKAVELLLETSASRIVYSSCNHETLAQDLLQLKDKFRIKRMKIFDMFPQTTHFETLVLLEKI